MKKILASLGILSLLGLTIPVLAATEASVAATVTVENISVSVSDGIVQYGTLVLNTTQDTVTLGDGQTATNDGNVTENILIRGQNSTSAGAGWALGATAGSEQYVHAFSTDGGTTYTALTTSNQSLAASVAASGNQAFDLKITTPTATTDFNEQTVNVTVVATL